MSMKIYTKTGDLGKTSLIGGTKVSKANIRIEAYGTIDELNSHIGMSSDLCPSENAKAVIAEIQNILFVIGSELANDPDKNVKMALPKLQEEDIQFLEKQIDGMESQLEPMKAFILPVGHVAVSCTHIARTVCRRAERTCVAMQDAGLEVDPLILKYLNRLSDYLFVLARYAAKMLGVADKEWIARKEPT